MVKIFFKKLKTYLSTYWDQISSLFYQLCSQNEQKGMNNQIMQLESKSTYMHTGGSRGYAKFSSGGELPVNEKSLS